MKGQENFFSRFQLPFPLPMIYSLIMWFLREKRKKVRKKLREREKYLCRRSCIDLMDDSIISPITFKLRTSPFPLRIPFFYRTNLSGLPSFSSLALSLITFWLNCFAEFFLFFFRLHFSPFSTFPPFSSSLPFSTFLHHWWSNHRFAKRDDGVMMITIDDSTIFPSIPNASFDTLVHVDTLDTMQ